MIRFRHSKNIFSTITGVLLLIVFFTQGLWAQDAPTLNCAFQLGNGDVELEWENNHNCGADFVSTQIFASETVGGPYTAVSLITDAAETNAIVPEPAAPTQYFYLVHECTAGVSLNSDTLDMEDPITPEILNVTVVGGTCLISWAPSPSPETFGYWIYNTNAGSPQLIDSIFVDDVMIDPSAPFYEDVLSTPGDGPEEYALSTFDACFEGGLITSEDMRHKTIHMTYEFDSCVNNIKIFWTAYQGWDTQEFRLFKNGDPTPVATLAPDEFSYEYDLTPADGGTLTFSVLAESTDGINSSRSNEVSIDVQLATLPGYIHFKNLSVIGENQIQLAWDVDPAGYFDHLRIYRGTDSLDMGAITDLGETENPIQIAYTDSEVLTDRAPWYYYIAVENSCGVQRPTALGKTIWLDGQDNLNLTNGLFWNEFEMANATVQEYRVVRIDGDVETELGVVASGSPLTFTDDVSDILPESGQYCYRIDGIFDCEVPGFPLVTDSTSSNNFCISQTSRIYVPNAFTPEGVNSEFKPVFVYPNDDNYKMVIMNRWGEKVFETTEPEVGWDGRIGGDLAQQGVYAYYIEMESFNGFILQRKGTLLLIRK